MWISGPYVCLYFVLSLFFVCPVRYSLPECLMISSPKPHRTLILLAVHFLIKFDKGTKTGALGLF